MMLRIALSALCLYAIAAPPAAAQIFWRPPDFRGLPLSPGEPGIGVALPGATPAEERAAWVWQLRSGLNVAALQCQFDATLLSRDSYNGVLMNHREELAASYATLANYFKRTSKTAKAGQTALDQYGTKTYIGFSTVRAQLGFCQTASGIAKAAMYAPRGSLAAVAVERLRELRNSLVPGSGEQQWRAASFSTHPLLPRLENKCWSRDRYKARCGVFPA